MNIILTVGDLIKALSVHSPSAKLVFTANGKTIPGTKTDMCLHAVFKGLNLEVSHVELNVSQAFNPDDDKEFLDRIAGSPVTGLKVATAIKRKFNPGKVQP